MIEGGDNYEETTFVQTVGELRPVIHNIGFDKSGRFLFKGSDILREQFANLMASYAIYPENDLPEGRSPIFPIAYAGEPDGAAPHPAPEGDRQSATGDDQAPADAADADGGGDAATDTAASGTKRAKGRNVGTSGGDGAAVAPAAVDDGFI